MKRLLILAAWMIMAMNTRLAIAESGMDTVDVTAGLQSLMTLTCTPVNLGVWRSPPRNSGGTTRVMLDIDYPKVGAKIFFNTKIAQAIGHTDWAPDFGVCTITSSRAIERVSAKVSISRNRLLRVVPVADRHTNVKAGRANFGIIVDVYAPKLVTIQNGEGSFLIGGGMTIPEYIAAGDYGGYVTAVYPMITVDDGMPD